MRSERWREVSDRLSEYEHDLNLLGGMRNVCKVFFLFSLILLLSLFLVPELSSILIYIFF